MICLVNKKMTAQISEVGAELRSLKKDGVEYMWSGDPLVWGNTAPVLFPTLCSLKDDKYILDGKTYDMPKHGFVRGKEFAVESCSESSATLLYTYNKETLTQYPFRFEFRATFTLMSDGIRVTFKIRNLGDEDMYFSVGSHEAYATPEGIEDYDIIFPCKENLDTVLLNGPLLQRRTMNIGRNTQYLPLYEKYFILDTLIFKNLKSRSLVLRNRKTEREITVNFPNCDYLGIWHKPSAGFLCIEPWSGLPDNDDTDCNIKTKEGILTLPAYGEYVNVHTVTV